MYRYVSPVHSLALYVFLYIVIRMSRNTLSESLEDEIMLLHLFEMQERNNSSISESSPWTPSRYSTTSKKSLITTTT